MKLIPKILPHFFISIWILSGVYFGISGVMFTEIKNLEEIATNKSDTTKVFYDGIEFSSKQRYIRYYQEKKINTFFSWIEKCPDLLVMIISCSMMGLFGSTIRVIYKSYQEKISLKELNYITIPFLGLFIGLLILGFSNLAPKIFLITDTFELNQPPLLFLCLFAGFNFDKIYNYLLNFSIFKKDGN